MIWTLDTKPVYTSQGQLPVQIELLVNYTRKLLWLLYWDGSGLDTGGTIAFGVTKILLKIKLY